MGRPSKTNPAAPPIATRPVGRPTKYDPSYCDALVEQMAKGYSLGAVAGHFGVSRATINVWAEQHPEFLDALSRGKAARLRKWEDIAIAVAEKGGGPGSATVVTFGLKNMGFEDWNAPDRVEHTGKDGGPIKTTTVFDLSTMTDAELEAYRTLASAAGGHRAGD